MEGLSHKDRACCAVESGDTKPSESCPAIIMPMSEEDSPEESKNTMHIVVICIAVICIFAVGFVIYIYSKVVPRHDKRATTPQILNSGNTEPLDVGVELVDGNTSLSDTSAAHLAEEGHGINDNVEENMKMMAQVMVDKAIVERLNSISESINGDIARVRDEEDTATRASANSAMMRESTIDIQDDEIDSTHLQQTEEDLERRLSNLMRFSSNSMNDDNRVEPVTRKGSKLDISTKLKGVEPTDNDVLFGRGWDKKDHKGNISFLEEALKYRDWYESATKEEKKNISELLVESVKSQGHRFLEMDLDSQWHEMSENEVLKMARQALRKKKRSSGISGSKGSYVREASELEQMGAFDTGID